MITLQPNFKNDQLFEKFHDNLHHYCYLYNVLLKTIKLNTNYKLRNSVCFKLIPVIFIVNNCN